MIRSFRLKIGLLSMSLSGLLLLGFGLYAVSQLKRVSLERIDRELLVLADAQVRKPQPDVHWRRFEESLQSLYGEEASRQFALLVTDPAGAPLYATADWPAGLPRDVLPLSLEKAPRVLLEGPDANPGGPRPRPFGAPPPRGPPPRRLPVRGPVYATLGDVDAGWRVMTLANEEVTLSLAMNLSALLGEARRFRNALLVGVPLGLLLIVAGGWLIGHLALRPVARIARTVESLTARRLDARVPEAQADAEFRRLILLINGMLERLERSFGQATRFSADAAHELKTPLAILQAQIERTLQRAPDGSPEQRESAAQLDEVQRLKAILGKLLLLSQADSGRLPLSPGPVDLAALAQAAAGDIRMLAPGRRVELEGPASLPVTGDAHLLAQAVDNLASNAVKFGNRDGVVRLTLAASPAAAVFRIASTGPVIPKEEQARLFERFYRGDKARTRDIEGTGLGLSLAREIARAHGGELRLESSENGETVFALTLPKGAGASGAA